MLEIENDPVWLIIISYFARLVKHGHGEKACMALLGALRHIGEDAGYDNTALASLLGKWCHQHFQEEDKDMWFKELERGKDEAVH